MREKIKKLIWSKDRIQNIIIINEDVVFVEVKQKSDEPDKEIYYAVYMIKENKKLTEFSYTLDGALLIYLSRKYLDNMHEQQSFIYVSQKLLNL